jgi:hypothetical protein
MTPRKKLAAEADKNIIAALAKLRSSPERLPNRGAESHDALSFTSVVNMPHRIT